MKRIIVCVVTAATFAVPTAASGLDASREYFPVYTGDQFQAIYEYAVANTLPNLMPPAEQPAITGDAVVDARIWAAARARGYRLRATAGDGLVTADGVVMQPQVAEAWKKLKAEARAEGLDFVVTSGYRSVSAQRTWFNSKLTGFSDSDIDSALRWYSVPGASKHHSGYAVDFRYRDGVFADFRSTPDYAWLSADNFYIPKKYGFIPSYPDDVSDAGPNPEPWEFVWVGVELIKCGLPLDLSSSRFGAAHWGWLEDGGTSCPGGVTIEELDRLFRQLGPKLEALLRV